MWSGMCGPAPIFAPIRAAGCACVQASPCRHEPFVPWGSRQPGLGAAQLLGDLRGGPAGPEPGRSARCRRPDGNLSCRQASFQSFAGVRGNRVAGPGLAAAGPTRGGHRSRRFHRDEAQRGHGPDPGPATGAAPRWGERLLAHGPPLLARGGTGDTAPFWLVQDLPRHGVVAGLYEPDARALGGMVERQAPRLFRDGDQLTAQVPCPLVPARTQLPDDLSELLAFCQASAASGRPAPWQPVLPLYPTSPVGQGR